MLTIMTVITFASFIVVAHEALTLSSTVKPIFQSMRAFGRGRGQSPDDHFDQDCPLGRFVMEELPCSHDGKLDHN
jgi:hypothetical protein